MLTLSYKQFTFKFIDIGLLKLSSKSGNHACSQLLKFLPVIIFGQRKLIDQVSQHRYRHSQCLSRVTSLQDQKSSNQVNRSLGYFYLTQSITKSSCINTDNARNNSTANIVTSTKRLIIFILNTNYNFNATLL